MGFLIRMLMVAGLAYGAILLALWAFQARFFYPAPQTVAPLTPGYEEVQLATSDGLALRAFYKAPEGPLPTIVYFHGNGGTLGGASLSNGATAAAGFGVLLVEYRGYGGNSGEPSEAGFYRDGEAAMAWLSEQGVAPGDTVIIGNSIGSGVATEMALRNDPAALILIAPFTSLPDAAADNLPWVPARLLVSGQYRTKDKIAELDMPILIQHGDADTLISDSHGRALAELSPASEFQSFAGSGHDLSFERRSQEARRDWLVSLQADAAPES